MPRLLHGLLFLFDYRQTLADHLKGCRVYDTLKREGFWPNTSTALYSAVRRYPYYLRKRNEFKKQCQRQLFLPNGPLKVSVIYLLGQLPRTWLGNQFVAIFTDWYSSRTGAIPTSNILPDQVADILPSIWYSAVKFQIKYYLTMSSILSANVLFNYATMLHLKMKTVAYHTQTNG